MTGGLVLVAVGLERLLNAYMLRGTAAADVPVAVGLALALAGGLLVGTVVIVGATQRHRGPSPPA